MTLRLRILPRAEHDAQHIFDWIHERSPQGARTWWTAFEDATARVLDHPAAFGVAPENALVSVELRQALFKTARGRTYRFVFTVLGDEVRILRVRGPGQSPLQPDEVSFE